nr:geraniol 8-hydroxylase-like isoform X3 [Ipomoea trifida]
MDYEMILVALCLAWTLVQCLRLLSKRYKTPPGPFPLPVIGNLHLLGDQPHKSLAQLAQKYGPVMNLKLGMINTVVISSSAMAKEALQKQDLAFSARSIPDVLRAQNHSQFSVIWLPAASKWRAIRKIMNSNIFSSSKLDANQQLRVKKIQELITYCQNNSQAGEAVDIGRAVFRTAMNLLSNTIFSKDLTDPYSDSAKEFKELVWNIMEEAAKPNLVDFYPFLEKFDPQGSQRRMSDYFTKVLDLFRDLIDERLEERRVSGNRNVDVLDTLLNISQETPDEIDNTIIKHLCLDLFVAGTDTSSITVEWAMTELFNNPDAMAKAQAELADVVGKGRLLNETDVAGLPYLQCIVKETFRLHPPAPLLLPRKVEHDVVLCGYTIPKDSKILFNIEGDIAPKDLNMEEKCGITLAKAHPLRAIPIPL